VCTLVPLIFFRAVWQVRKRKHARIMQITALALGVIFALPNLLSLTVVLGNNNAAHAGERILDVDGPGFRGASVVGAVLGVALFLGLVALGYMYKKRGKDLDKMRGELKQHEPQSKGEAPAPEI
jgi:preprotein translocase subunit SecG